MPRPDLSRLTPAEKDALIPALLDRIAALEAKLGEPPKTPDNSSLPPSRGRKKNRPPRPKRARRKRTGPGVTRARAAAPDRTVGCYAERCRHCGVSLDGAGQTLRQAYDHIELPPPELVEGPAGGDAGRDLRSALPVLPVPGAWRCGFS